PFGGFGEGNNVPNAGRAAKNGHQAVETQRDAAVGWRAVFEGLKQVAKPQLRLVRRDLQDLLEHRFLDFRVMNSDRAAPQLDSVDHDIIVLAPDFAGVGFEERDVLGHGGREWMVAGIPAVLLLVEAQQREVHEPKEIKIVGWDVQLSLCFEQVGAIKADFAQNFARAEPLVGGEEDQIAFFQCQLFRK